MPLSLHNLKPAKGSRKNRKRVGRGNASGHGTYSGRGLKGQKSRSGGKGGLKKKGLKPILQNIPKIRGFKTLKPNKQEVWLSDLEKNFSVDEKITPASLLKRGLTGNIKVSVKILGQGEVTKKFIIEGCAISASAREKIEKAGGTVEIIEPRVTSSKKKRKKKKTKTK